MRKIIFGMVNKLVSLLILLLTLMCGSVHTHEVSKNLLIGSWAACVEDGLYVELHFSEENEYAYHLDNEILDYNVGKYIVCLDMVHVAIQEKNLDCEQIEDVHQMKIRFVSDDEFENNDQGKKNVFIRLSNQPLMKYKQGTISLEREGYLEEFKFRKDTFNCFNRVRN